MPGGKGFVHLMLHVIAHCGGSQLQGGGVFLSMCLKLLYALGHLSCTKHKHTGGQRVERSGVSDFHLSPLAFAAKVAHVSQSTEARHLVGLVDGYNFPGCEVYHRLLQTVMAPTMAQ